ncbi:MAG: CotH kinase family protein [Flavobacteriales bacterium]|nr:CotH kinase family protein [Flavobacteriales bacterium]
MRIILLLAISFCVHMANAQLRINEFSAHKGLVDGGEEHDWIEIMNTGAQPVQLSDYFLSDKTENPLKWQMPEYELGAGEFITICASGWNVNESVGTWESFVVAENIWDWQIATSDIPDNWIDVDFDASDWNSNVGGLGYNDGDDNTEIPETTALYMRREFTAIQLENMLAFTFHADYDDGFVAYLNGVEIARSNVSGTPPDFDTYADGEHEALVYQGGQHEEFLLDTDYIQSILIEGLNTLAIQVHNSTPWSSDLTANFYLSVGLLGSEGGYENAPSWFNTSTSTNAYYHTNFKLSPGEDVLITHTNNTLEDAHPVSDLLSFGLSQGRYPDGVGDWCFFDQPTPDEGNEPSWCYDAITPTPSIELPSGWYSGTQSTGVSAPNATVRFTLNGDIPTENDPVYNGILEFDENATLTVRAFGDGNFLPSQVVDRTYIFNEDNHDLLVFSIHTDQDNLWDWDEGIYVSGPNASQDYPFFGSNFWQPWSKYSRMEVFNQDKELVSQEHFDLEIHGGWSRAEPQKSFRIDFKSAYTGRLEYPLFSQKPFIQDFNNLNLRNGGQHVWSDKMQDGWVSRIVNDNTAIDNMAWEPCIVYLNGEYWGMYEVREKMDEHYLESNHSVSSDALDLLNPAGLATINSEEALAGTTDQFTEAYLAIMAEDADSESFYTLADSYFDMDNYMDYFAVQTLIQNVDWMGIAWGLNNVKAWRPHNEDGKWRYMMYDVDGAVGYFGQNINDNYLAFARTPLYASPNSQIFDKMCTNDEFRCSFSNRYADLINTIFQPESFIQIANDMQAEMQSGIPDHVDRWASPESVTSWEYSIDLMVNYMEDRIPTAREHLQSNLGLGQQVEIVLDVLPAGAGQVKISTITPDAYPWQGVYFDGCPVNVEAIANEGYIFSHWSENNLLGGESLDQQLLLSLSEDDIFVANFIEEIDNSISESTKNIEFKLFPNPSSGYVNLELFDNGTRARSVRVLNSIGQAVYTKQLNIGSNSSTTVLDLSQLPKGVYMVEVMADQTYVQRLVLQ